jgi:type IV pilus assembly protein PilE
MRQKLSMGGDTIKGKEQGGLGMRKHTAKGFTLIELMVVIAIIAIIAAIAIPGYTEQVRKGRRADAGRFVGDLQLRLEQWRAENPCYGITPSPACDAISGTYPTAPTSAVSPYYTIAIGTATQSAYTITATPTGVQAGDRCGTLTLNSATNGGKPSWDTASCN